MKQPKYLNKGDKIMLVAPSFGCTTEPYSTRLDVAVNNWKKQGYVVEEGPNVRLALGVACSNTPEARAKEIMDAFHSDATLISSAGGGEMMMDMLPYIDFEEIKRLEPKWFMGFSDNTNLTFTLATLSGLITIYGSCTPSFYPKKWRCAELDCLRLLTGETHIEGYMKYSITHTDKEHPLYQYRLTQPKIIKAEGYVSPISGTLLGGCLDVLLILCGTKYDKVKEFNAKHPEGIIWFLEACDLSPLSLRRGLFTLREAGWFDNAKGFLLGRHLCGNVEIMGVDKYNAVLDILAPLGKPILMDVDLGHIPPSMPIKCGAEAKVAFEDGNIVIDYLK